MKIGGLSICGSWGIALLLVGDIIPISDDLKLFQKLIPLLVIFIGHGYGVHRITKKHKK